MGQRVQSSQTGHTYIVFIFKVINVAPLQKSHEPSVLSTCNSCLCHRDQIVRNEETKAHKLEESPVDGPRTHVEPEPTD